MFRIFAPPESFHFWDHLKPSISGMLLGQNWGCSAGVRTPFFSEVKRELRWRGAPRSRQLEDTTSESAAKVSTFFSPQAGKTAQQRKARLKYTTQAKPRLATLHWLQDMSNALAAIGHSLLQYSGQGSFLQEEGPLDKAPRFLMMCTDQEALQLTAMNFLRFGKQVCAVHRPDPQHRRSNDTALAIAEAGMGARVAFTCTHFKVQYGPLQKADFISSWWRCHRNFPRPSTPTTRC